MLKNPKPTLGILKHPILPAVLAILGALYFFVQLIYYAHTQESVLDEGAYLYKGYLFASGQYRPFQAYGPWSNHMPLAFLIPGTIQLIFGAGIRTGRYFAIFLAMLTLLGIWVLARRFGNRWWGAAAIWIVALNTILSKMYSTGISQGLVICMLTWMLMLVLGHERPWWQLILGSILAGLIFITRINLIPVLPILVGYILWEYGRKAALQSAVVGGLVVVIGHAVFWPNIMQVWTILPKSLTPFLSSWRLPPGYEGVWEVTTSSQGRWLSFFQVIRFHFASMVGAITAWLLWPPRSKWKSQSDFRAGVFLSFLFVILLVLHIYFSVGGDYCVFCMPGYLGFFFILGLMLLIIASSNWQNQISFWRQGLIFAVVLFLCTGIGYSAFEDIGNQLININIPGWLVGSASPGDVTLGAVLVNKFGLEYRDLRRLLPIVFGFGSGLILLFLTFIIKKISTRIPQKSISGSSFGYLFLVLFLVIGTVLSPSLVLGGGYSTYDCSWDVIRSYEKAGEHLNATIPEGSLVYWKGTLSAVPLLYVKNIRIFPAQINDGYSLVRIGEDADLLMKFGRWNREMGAQWAHQSDFVLIEQRSYDGWLKDLIESGKYLELESTLPAVPCRLNSRIRIFKNPGTGN